jgi:hypothetical protein
MDQSQLVLAQQATAMQRRAAQISPSTDVA